MCKINCPICLDDKTKNKTITLECKHNLCIDCARKWLIEKSSCPMCRNISDYFYKNTRSQRKANNILFFMELEIVYARINNLEEWCEYMDFYILKNRHIWYKPTMNNILKKILYPIQENIPLNASNKNKKIIQNLIQLSKISI